jgi:putative peptidoglycan lipid II flippase
MAIPLPPALGIEPRWGVAGLTISAGLAGWIEFALLRRTLCRRIGPTGLPLAFTAKLWSAAGVAAAAGWAVKLAIGEQNPILAAALILGMYAAVYIGLTAAFGLEQARTAFSRIKRVL